jgi:hypothetical protein
MRRSAAIAGAMITLLSRTAAAQPIPAPPQPAAQPIPAPPQTQPAAQPSPWGPPQPGAQPSAWGPPQPGAATQPGVPAQGPFVPQTGQAPGQLGPSSPQGQPAWQPNGAPPMPGWGPPLPQGPYAAGGDPRGDLARLERILTHHAHDGRSYGIAMGVSGLVTGSVAIPTAIYMLSKKDNPIPGGITLGIGIGSTIGGIVSFFVPSGDLDSLGRSLEEKKENGEAPQQIVAEIEREWHDRAAATRATRKGWGITGVVLGTIVMGVGTGFAIADPISDNISRPEQQAMGAVLLGAGAANVAAGFTGFFLETPVESTWDVYASWKGGPIVVPAPPPRFGFAPLRGLARGHEAWEGGVLTMSGAF